MNGYPPPRNNMPLIILAVVGIAVVIYFVTKKKPYADSGGADTGSGEGELPLAEPVDPCKGVPDWACAATKLLNPLAKTSVDLYSIKKGVYQPPQQY